MLALVQEAASNPVEEKGDLLATASRNLETAMSRAFARQGRVMARELEKYRDVFDFAAEGFRSEAIGDLPLIGDSAINAANDAATLATQAEMAQAEQRAVELSYRLGGESLAAQLGLNIAFDLDSPEAFRYIQQSGATLVTRISSTNRDELRRIILDATREKKSYTELAKQIRDTFDGFAGRKPQAHIRDRAELVAVTETGNAYETAGQNEARNLQRAGLNMFKRWWTSNDGKVTPRCSANQAEGWIPLDNTHGSGHSTPLRFPGCRCTELYESRPL